MSSRHWLPGSALLLILFAALLWQAGMAARADAPPQPELREAEPWLTLAAQPRFSLWLTSSRDLCTAGTPTEISWNISGGSAPYRLTIEGEAVDANAENIRINCGALTETEAADEQAALAAKRITATVTDSRGVRREAALDVARARALPAPIDLGHGSHRETATISWSQSDPLLQSASVVRYRPIGAGPWRYSVFEPQLRRGALTFTVPAGEHVAAVAAIRHELEAETPSALLWSEEIHFARATPPQNLTVTATHDTVTVSWDKQPYAAQMPYVTLTPTSLQGSLGERVFEQHGVSGRHEVVFKHVPPSTDYVVAITMSDGGEPFGTRISVRTSAPPPDWSPPPRGPQNLRATATRDSIAVTWEHPHGRVRAPYAVHLIDEQSGALLNYRWISTRTNWTIRGSRNGAPLRSGKQYRIRVQLMSFGVPADEVVVRIPAAQTAVGGATDEEAQPESPPFPFYPR